MSRQRHLLNIMLVYFLIFASGSLRYNQSDDKYLVIGLLAAFIVWLIYTDRKISGSFLIYCITFSGFLFSLSIYTDGSLTLASVISTTMKLMMAYLIIKTVGDRFTRTYVDVVVFLAVISLLGYFSDVVHLFDGLVHKLPVIRGRGYDGVFYIFRDTFHPYRNQSIFFEPGAYQAFLNAALFIMFFASPNIGRKRQWFYIIVLIAALITAFSTTGFMIFLCLFALFLYRSDITSFYGKLILVGLAMVIVIVFSAQFYTRFVEKIDDYLAANEYDFSWSANTRSSQLKADIRVIKKHIFGLGQRKYLEEFRDAGRTADNKGSSNGVTRIVAVYGLPFGVFIFGSYYWALRKLIVDPLLASAAFIMFLMFLGGESYYISTPYSFSIIAGAFVIASLKNKEEDFTNERARSGYSSTPAPP